MLQNFQFQIEKKTLEYFLLQKRPSEIIIENQINSASNLSLHCFLAISLLTMHSLIAINRESFLLFE
jgi:hypothetical protein